MVKAVAELQRLVKTFFRRFFLGNRFFKVTVKSTHVGVDVYEYVFYNTKWAQPFSKSGFVGSGTRDTPRSTFSIGTTESESTGRRWFFNHFAESLKSLAPLLAQQQTRTCLATECNTCAFHRQAFFFEETYGGREEREEYVNLAAAWGEFTHSATRSDTAGLMEPTMRWCAGAWWGSLPRRVTGGRCGQRSASGRGP